MITWGANEYKIITENIGGDINGSKMSPWRRWKDDDTSIDNCHLNGLLMNLPWIQAIQLWVLRAYEVF